jgi:hypothetical protein
MKEISTTAWVVMGCFGVFVILINLGLWASLKRRDTSQGEWLQRFAQSIRKPYAQEDSQLRELSERVGQFKRDTLKDHPDKDIPGS